MIGIENAIYLVLGFLVASLLALVIAPSIWMRAVRLTKRRIESANPVTMSEFRADKDQLRAEFALSTRQLEMKIEALRTRLAEQLGDANTAKSNLAILKVESERENEIFDELKAREANARERLHELEKQNTDLAQRLRMRDRELSELQANNRQRAANDTLGPTAIADIRDALAADETTAPHIGDAPAPETRISAAASELDQLLQETGLASSENNGAPSLSLAEKFLQDDEMARLRQQINIVEQSIMVDWDNGDADKTALRKQLGEIASTVSSLVYAVDGDSTEAPEETLFDRVQKFAGQDLNAKDMPAGAAPRRTKLKDKSTGRSVSDRMAAFQSMQVNN